MEKWSVHDESPPRPLVFRCRKPRETRGFVGLEVIIKVFPPLNKFNFRRLSNYVKVPQLASWMSYPKPSKTAIRHGTVPCFLES